MPTLSESRISALLAPFIPEIPATLPAQLSTYLDLLLRWNARTNLTAVRDPEEIVTRHFGESLFAARALAPHLAPDATVLDFGSGAGFPGLPIQLLYPELRVTLAESQNKKAAFLREAVRTLALPHTEVWAARAEQLPPGRIFQAVTLRAVDNPVQALAEAQNHLAPGGKLLHLHGEKALEGSLPIPGSQNRWVTIQSTMFHVEHTDS
jgi:16S rRNA (guanine527-N7)-methyltransferase